jgi:hypothetical protein
MSAKKPLCGNRQKKNHELKLMQTPAPASTLSFSAHSSATRMLLQRDRFKIYFANSPLGLAIAPPAVNGYKPL